MWFPSLLSLWRAFGALVAHALAPSGCAACDAPVRWRAILCASCARAVVRARGGTDAAAPIAFGLFGGALALAIRRFKFADRPDLARPLGDLVRRAARDAAVVADVIVPVPLHPRRLAERGYNQAALLASAVARELGVPVVPLALARVRNTAQQARLDRQARLVNVERAFRARDAPAVAGRRVLLVDDVATTGATLDACAEALLEAGAASVQRLVVARAEGPSDREGASRGGPSDREGGSRRGPSDREGGSRRGPSDREGGSRAT